MTRPDSASSRAASPQSVEATIRSVRYTWTPYAIYLDALGPAETDLIDAHGQRTVRSRTPAGAAMFELVGGELSHNPLMGDIWVLASDFDCTATSSRQRLSPLCNP